MYKNWMTKTPICVRRSCRTTDDSSFWRRLVFQRLSRVRSHQNGGQILRCHLDGITVVVKGETARGRRCHALFTSEWHTHRGGKGVTSLPSGIPVRRLTEGVH